MAPHNREAENSLLGGILRDPEILSDVQAAIALEDFYFDASRKVFEAMGNLSLSGSPVELVALHSELKAHGWLADVGGPEYIAEIWESAACGVNSLYYAKLVRDASNIRRLIYTANEILRDAQEGAADADELLATAERKILAIADATNQGGDTVKSIKVLLNDAMRRIDEGKGLAGLATGYEAIDNMLGGLRPGELIIVGARPSVGKTAICLNLAVNAAVAGSPVLFFSLEMREEEIAERMLSMGSGVPMHKFTRARFLSDHDAERLIHASSSDGLAGCGIWVESTSSQLPARIAAITRRAIRRHGVKLIVVDYLQLMRTENPKENRTQQVGMLALRMKHLARDCGVPVLVPSQLNRESENRGKPRLSDLRESGDIEAHADRVILLHREPNQTEEHEVWPIEVIVAKNRNGPIGSVVMDYRRPVMRFEQRPAGGGW